MSPTGYNAPYGGGGGQQYGYQPPADNNYYYNNGGFQNNNNNNSNYNNNVNSGGVSVGRRATTLGRAPTRRIVPGANSIANASSNIQRGRTLIRPDRYQEPPPLLTGKPTASRSLFDPWVLFSRIVTFWALPPMLKAFKMGDAGSLIGILGWQFNVSSAKTSPSFNPYSYAQVPGTDVTNFFGHGLDIPECINTGNSIASTFLAVNLNPCESGGNACIAGELSAATLATYGLVNSTKQVGFDWNQLASANLANFFVIDGNVLNMDPYIQTYPTAQLNDPLDAVIRTILNSSWAEGGRDGTKMFFRKPEYKAAINCLVQKYRAGHIDKKTTGCFVASIILICSLAVVLAIVLARFFMALIFSWFVSRKLSRTPPPAP
ncbi:hypothetical protein CU097_000469, partial [Rhizopus azygosporus]